MSVSEEMIDATLRRLREECAARPFLNVAAMSRKTACRLLEYFIGMDVVINDFVKDENVILLNKETFQKF